MTKRSKSWVFTINNWTEEDETRITLLGAQYTVYGKEIGASGTPHLQGYVYFKNQRSLKSMSKKLPRAFLEKRLGSHEQARDYCKKDGDFVEIGIEPQKSGGDSAVERARKNKRLRELPLEELVMSGELALNQVPVIKKARLILDTEGEPVNADDVRGVWIYGPPGTGKSHSARTEYGKVFIKPQNKWFDGYSGEKTIVLEDLDTNVLGHYLKIWADKWSCTGEVKGGTVALKHETFIVTSNYSIEELWSEDMMMQRAIKRRFKIVEKKIKYT